MKITSSQLVTWNRPSTISWPAGVCIHEFSARIQNADSVVPKATRKVDEQVHPLADPAVAEQHDAQEGGFEEEGGQHLVAEQRPGDVADASP